MPDSVGGVEGSTMTEAVAREPAISDHALVRFIERIKGVSLDNYRREMQVMMANGQPLCAEVAPPYNSAVFVINDLCGTVVTVLLGTSARPRTGFGYRIVFATENNVRST